MSVNEPVQTLSLSPQDFLNTVSGYTQATAPDTSANRPVKLATVMVLGASNTVQVQFDGETVTSTKYYPCLATYVATVGDRVALMPTGTTYLVIGAVGTPAANQSVSGNLTVGGTLTANALSVTTTTFGSYTPAIANGGTLALSTADGWYFKLGKLVYFEAYCVVGTAGSGSTAVTITAPSTPYRSGRRQSVPGACRDGTSNPIIGPISALTFAGGSGAVFDRIMTSGADVTGVNLVSGAIITLNGWYREA
jgi:hypothetical protein